MIGNVQDEVINIENLVEQYHRTCFVKEPKSYSRNILIVVLVHGIVLMSAGQDQVGVTEKLIINYIFEE